ncbi:MAG: branched-chain amino acid ABC transporter permease [Firmicutes bacterium]|nr:branched-chain amino acid ABC transporter permease [Bacillota bacterium]
MDYYVIQFLNGLSYAMLLFLLATGLSLVFGMMNIINLAHGSFYMLGAYLGYSTALKTGNFWLSLLVAPLVIGLVGFILEFIFLRPLYARGHLQQVLLTVGFIFVIWDVTTTLWGKSVMSVAAPPLLAGTAKFWGVIYPSYRFFLIGFGLVAALALWLLLERTRLGAVVRAGVADQEMVGGLGINIKMLFSSIFAFGTALAALGGVLAAPVLGLHPGMDMELLIAVLIVVVVGGLGTFAGSFWGALLIGEADTFGKILIPEWGLVIIYAVMTLVLLLKPEGLLVKKGA